MEEQPPQDDDPNSSTLNPLSFPLSLPALHWAKGSFLKNWGGQDIRQIDKSNIPGYLGRTF
jgi:hypothetical protein